VIPPRGSVCHVISAGLQVHIPKPVDPIELIAVVAQVAHVPDSRSMRS
jgi:hypothetical protein